MNHNFSFYYFFLLKDSDNLFDTNSGIVKQETNRLNALSRIALETEQALKEIDAKFKTKKTIANCSTYIAFLAVGLFYGSMLLCDILKLFETNKIQDLIKRKSLLKKKKTLKRSHNSSKWFQSDDEIAEQRKRTIEKNSELIDDIDEFYIALVYNQKKKRISNV